LSEGAPSAGLEIAEEEGADAGSAEAVDGMADCFQHAADHAFAAGVNGQLDEGSFAAGAQEANSGGPAGAVVKHDTAREPAQHGGGGAAADLGLVHFFDLVAGVGEAIGEVAVVGDEEQALGVGVEATGGVEALFDVPQQIEDGGAAAMVYDGGKGAAGLVEEEVPLGLGAKQAAVELNP
jgi:hypothetical protein